MKCEADWAILLELFVSGARGRQVTVSDACIASGAPGSTALRRLARLEAMGIINREDDPCDRRRSLLVLPARVKASMAAYFAGAANN